MPSFTYPNTVATLPGTWSYLYRSPLRVGGSADGWNGQVTFDTTFANMGAFCSAVAGQVTTVTSAYGGLARILPLQHPLFSNLYATSLEAEAYGTPSATSQALGDLWSNARIAVNFESPKYLIAGDAPFLTFEIDRGSVYTTIPGRKFRFTNGEPIDQNAGTFAVQNAYILTSYQCSAQHDDLIDLVAAAPLNDAPFFGKPAGTLLFGGVRSMLQVSMGGVILYQKSYSFLYRSTPWNQAYRRDSVLDTPVDPAGFPEYGTSDFSTLLN